MKSRNYTTPEQSKKLLELGLDSKTADYMFVWDFTSGALNGHHEIIPGYFEPTEKDLVSWSLARLLDLFPPDKPGEGFIITRDRGNRGWFVRSRYVVKEESVVTESVGPVLLDSVFDVLCGLLSKKII